MKPPRMYETLWKKIKAQVNTPVIVYVPKDKQHTVRRMICKERWKDKTLQDRNACILVFSNITETSITVTWKQHSGAALGNLVNSGQPLYLDITKELEEKDATTD